VSLVEWWKNSGPSSKTERLTQYSTLNNSVHSETEEFKSRSNLTDSFLCYIFRAGRVTENVRSKRFVFKYF